MTSPSPRELALILGAGILAAAGSLGISFHGPALSDEFVYLAGAHRFADSGSRNSTYYFSDSILRAGFPHQDAHSPGYVVSLGLVSRILGFGYDSAVILNVICLVGLMGLLWDIARLLDRPRSGRLLTATAIVTPALFPYVSWVMAESLVVGSAMATLWLAARFGQRTSGAFACGLALGYCVLLRESAIFLVPPLLVLIGLSLPRVSAFGGAFLACQLLVWVPMNAGRPPVFTAPVGGSGVASGAVIAAKEGRVADALVALGGRAKRNLTTLAEADARQQVTIGGLLAIPFLGWLGFSTLGPKPRRLMIGLTLSLVAIIAVTLSLLEVGDWNGLRYWIALIVPFFALLPAPATVSGRAALGAALLACLGINLAVLAKFQDFKSGGSGIDEVKYFDRFVLPGSYERVVWQNGYRLGLSRYPTEVIVSIPQSRDEYRALEKAVWFDYVVLSSWQTLLDDRQKYERVNASDPDPLLKIFRRVR